MKKHLFILLTIISSTVLAQTTISTVDFDAPIAPDLPTGWTTTTNFNLGWRSDSSNFSTGYSNSSGLKNVVIRNSDSTGTYQLFSPIYSTLNFNNISVLWASRVSNNFITSGSTTPTCQFSIDGGSSWSNVAFLENNANSTWDFVNGGVRIMLSALANNQNTFQLRWTINIVTNPAGTYRIDDFSLQGTSTTGVETLNPFASSWITNSGNTIFLHPFFTSPCRFELADISGRLIINQYVKNATNFFLPELHGFFIATLRDDFKILSKKIFIP
jgi:hypothetical protein